MRKHNIFLEQNTTRAWNIYYSSGYWIVKETWNVNCSLEMCCWNEYELKWPRVLSRPDAEVITSWKYSDFCHWVDRMPSPWLLRRLKFQFSCLVMSDPLWPHGLQHTSLLSLSPTPRAYSDSCPLGEWCHPTTSSSVVLFPPSVFPSIRVFSSESVLPIRWPKYWSFSFSLSPSNEYSGLISFKCDCENFV